MASYAYLNADLTCPHCNEHVADIVLFQWGFSPGYGPRKENIYHIGDRVFWKRCKDGKILKWTYFGEQEGGNLGDPDYKNLIISDTAQHYLKELLLHEGKLIIIPVCLLDGNEKLFVNTWKELWRSLV